MQHEKICKNHGILSQENIIVEPNKSAKRGYTLRCKICKSIKDETYRRSNRKELSQKSKAYKAAHRDIVNAWNREDRKVNPDKYRQYEKNYIIKYGKEKGRKLEAARIHGLTVDQYDAMFEKQNHLCAICNLPETKIGRGGDVSKLTVDHCHNTNVNRGLLCHHCNVGIGNFKDDPILLQSAIDYLKHHQSID